jgi:diguanylate cyclase (GGDEF)-like protein
MARDITEKKALEKKLEQAALYDNLTALPNRALILEKLKKALALAARNQAKLALLFCDLDGFKEVNDSLGHKAGDVLLQIVAKRLLQTIREMDDVGRLGGDEFLIILQDVGSLENAQKIVDKLCEAVAQPCQLNSEELITIHASIGVSIYPDDAIDFDALIHQSDKKMYQTKLKNKAIKNAYV